MREEVNKTASAENDPFGLRNLDWETRVPEKSEMFTDEEARLYIRACDYPKSADDLLLALEINERFSEPNIENMNILVAMDGGGRLGRELLQFGAGHVTFHDGHTVMLDHAQNMASKLFPENRFSTILSPVDKIAAPDNTFDLVVVHNSTHQLSSEDRLQQALQEFVRVTKPGGWIVIADYQRGTSASFLTALEERLKWTKREIVQLLIDSMRGAFSLEQFRKALESLTNVQEFLVFDASLPTLTPDMLELVQQDPVRHELDFSPLSLRAIARKGGI
ncbi:MAG: hypothetical protein ACD_48C00054G0001 [uncultured bacterium]|nr:MAG: hypothetical protein ACD_48C00054G0001 [uncultured bacterium]